MVCPAIYSYSFEAAALIFCRMFINIMKLCMSTGFWWSGGGIICVLQHTSFLKNLRIFDKNQNPVDMHTSIMCINILQNIKAVALKL
jgi:hypothetical protein